jgi:hypothetical protein
MHAPNVAEQGQQAERNRRFYLRPQAIQVGKAASILPRLTSSGYARERPKAMEARLKKKGGRVARTPKRLADTLLLGWFFVEDLGLCAVELEVFGWY